MKKKKLIPVVTAFLFLLINGLAYGSNGLSYEDTVKTIKETMASNASYARKESYHYIKFNGCNLDYNVSGTYPVGTTYNLRFSNLDFTGLNPQLSKTGHDYTAFVTLNFNNYFHSKDDFKDIKIRTVVVNVSTDESAQLLFKAFH